MKIKEIINNKLEKSNIRDSRKYNFYKTNPRGISLIVLVITIIVIIILATAIILTLNKNNPIAEANRARYESDRDSMQSIFTNTVTKVMSKNQGSINIKEGQINSIKSGVNTASGEVEYSIDNPVKSENKEGKIIFDNGQNTEVEYYTGRKLPIYKAGETIWSVDSQGVIKLQIGNIDYGDNNGSSNDGTLEEDKTNISKEEYEKLKLDIETLKNTIDTIKNDNDNINKAVESLKNNISSGNTRAGEVTIGVLQAKGQKDIKVNFGNPMENTNYSVAITNTTINGAWGWVRFKVMNKTKNGFTIFAFNDNTSVTDNVIANYIVVPYN